MQPPEAHPKGAQAHQPIRAPQVGVGGERRRACAVASNPLGFVPFGLAGNPATFVQKAFVSGTGMSTVAYSPFDVSQQRF